MPKILLVEDNEMSRDMLSRRLVRKGYEVLLAADGAKGAAVTAAERPDLVLMDMSLAVLDGWEATRRLKSAPETRSIPVIALTAHAMAGECERALAAGCDDFDTKPVDFGRLPTKIRAHLPGGVTDEDAAAILLVDDNEDNRYTLARRLEREGYRARRLRRAGGRRSARPAERALDLVLLDVMMPELDGIAVLAQMKADPPSFATSR